jgi:hypothetical protein
MRFKADLNRQCFDDCHAALRIDADAASADADTNDARLNCEAGGRG